MGVREMSNPRCSTGSCEVPDLALRLSLRNYVRTKLHSYFIKTWQSTGQ